mgnify:CR=1 FL=1|tara:strand:- start:16851 stop:17600 length:750 start_codon:yes stop_codon:yes gene_type:complete
MTDVTIENAKGALENAQGRALELFKEMGSLPFFGQFTFSNGDTNSIFVTPDVMNEHKREIAMAMIMTGYLSEDVISIISMLEMDMTSVSGLSESDREHIKDLSIDEVKEYIAEKGLDIAKDDGIFALVDYGDKIFQTVYDTKLSEDAKSFTPKSHGELTEAQVVKDFNARFNSLFHKSKIMKTLLDHAKPHFPDMPEDEAIVRLSNLVMFGCDASLALRFSKAMCRAIKEAPNSMLVINSITLPPETVH